MMSYFREN